MDRSKGRFNRQLTKKIWVLIKNIVYLYTLKLQHNEKEISWP